MNMPFQDKIILITGAAGGIGAATAKLAVDYGAKIVLHDREESEELKKLAEELNAKYITADVTSQEEVTKAVENAIQSGDKIDVLINCAGINDRTPFLETSDEQWQKIIDVNLFGTIHFCKAIIPLMQKQGCGRIVNIASLRAYSNMPGHAAYSASKASIVALTASLAKEFAPSIAVNAVAPGFTDTAMTKDWDEETKQHAQQSLMQRFAKPEEIAEIILFLASERASFITGQTILADGGYGCAGK